MLGQLLNVVRCLCAQCQCRLCAGIRLVVLQLVIAHLSLSARSKLRILETCNLIFAHLVHAFPACTLVSLMLLAPVLRRSDAQALSTHPQAVLTHWLPVSILPIPLSVLLVVLSAVPVAEMDLAVTVVPYWPIVLILFLTSALMDNVFELKRSVAILMDVLLIILIAVMVALVLQVVQLAPQLQLAQLPCVLTVLAVQLVLRI